MTRSSYLTTILFLVGAFASANVSGPAFAQAGSAGGTIGNVDKSAASAPESRHEPSPRRASARHGKGPGSPMKESACQRVVGTWHWFNGGDAVFNSDGTGQKTTGLTFTWTCSGGNYVLTWSHGAIDRLRISADDAQLDGSNGFLHVSATRK
jgi:hypothetical protein